MSRKVLLVGWDGADWEHITPLLEKGLMPTLESVINGGVMGNLATLQPVLSPMLWNSIATGKYPFKHGIHGFIERDPHHGGARPYTSYSRKCKALWNILSQEGLRTNVINWWASHPAEKINGCVVTNAFNGLRLDPKRGIVVSPGTIHPESKTEFLRQFKVFPQELTAEQLCPFVPKAAQIDQEEDSRLEMLAKVVSETLTTHAVATAVMEIEPWDFMAVYYTGVDHFSHGFMQYHPPKMDHISDQDFEIFQDVINGCYRFHDMMLERLLQLAGDETTVLICSDHGFQSRGMRPTMMPREPAGPAIWHRQYGILLARGPGIKKDERIYGASLVDITPTILAMYDRPIGEDMDGRLLVEIFEQPPHICRIPSWEDVPGADGMHTSETPVDEHSAADLMRQFAALGYIDDPGENKQEQADNAEVEAKYNLARNLDWVKRTDDAIPVMEDLVHRRPWETRFIVELARQYKNAGFLRQASKLISSAFDLDSTEYPLIRLMWADIQIALGNPEPAIDMLRVAERTRLKAPPIFNQIGNCYIRLRRWRDALRAFAKAAKMHPDNAEAYRGLATVHRRLGNNKNAVDAALGALALVYRLPQTHLDLGIALARGGQTDRAIVALETALKYEPNMAAAHRWLGMIYRSRKQDEAKAGFHARKLEVLRDELAKQRTRQRERRDRTFDLPEFPTEPERHAIAIRERPLPTRDRRKKSGKEFVLVSGLPRSGTSLMMQILEAGGLPPKTDGQRERDVDNPKGYYEWEGIKRLTKDPNLLDEEGLDKKAIKVVSLLLPRLPFNHNYKVIFMTRPLGEVVASQQAMVQRLETQGSSKTADQLAAELQQHRDHVLDWMQHHPRLTFIEIDYPSLVQKPEEWVSKIVEFLGPQFVPTPNRMCAVIDRSLYRQRAEGPTEQSIPAETSAVSIKLT